MTPKEKAKELVEKFKKSIPINYDYEHGEDIEEQEETAKQCTLIAIDEILNSILGNYEFDFLRKYWQEVKQEIEKL